jgi:hypothetical protein
MHVRRVRRSGCKRREEGSERERRLLRAKAEWQVRRKSSCSGNRVGKPEGLKLLKLLKLSQLKRINVPIDCRMQGWQGRKLML